MAPRNVTAIAALTIPFAVAFTASPAVAEDEPSSPFDLIPAAAAAPHQERDDGSWLVEVTAVSTDAVAAVRDAVAAAGGDTVTVATDYGVVVAWLPQEAMGALESRADVLSVVAPAPPATSGQVALAATAGSARFVQLVGVAAPAPTAAGPVDWVTAPSCRTVPVEADAPLAAAVARAAYGVDGTGITIGIISDSYDSSLTATSAADDVAVGVLPGPGNPCGYLEPVTVIEDFESGDDEGRAMAQLVHGIAPGARILFATGFVSPYSMAENIGRLVAAGADIIVDDIGWPSEPVYQAGVLADAIDAANAAGVSYYSASGNSSVVDADGDQIASWSTSGLTTAACPAIALFADPSIVCLDFGLDAPDSTMRTTIGRDPTSGAAGLDVWLRWDEPWYGVGTPLAAIALTTDPTDPQVIAGGFCPGAQEGQPYACDAPYAMMGIDASPVAPAGDEQVEVDIVVFTDADPAGLQDAEVRVSFERSSTGGSLVAIEHDRSGTGQGRDVVVGAALLGHNAAKGTFAVGAADWTTPDTLESYSSWGAVAWSWESVSSQQPGTPAAALATPWQREGVDAVGVDGTLTSFFGDDNRFYGTSAAAPHVAAVAALIVDAVPDIAVDDLEQALRDGGAAVTSPTGVDPIRAVGAGLVQADAALDAAGAESAPLAEPVPPALVPADTAALVGWQSANAVPEYVADVVDGVATVEGIPASLGDWAWVYGYSTPTDLGWHPVDAGRLAVPVANLGEGQHHLALFRGDTLVATVLIPAAEAPVLPATGAEATASWPAALLSVAGLALLLVAARRRRRSAASAGAAQRL